MSGYRHIICVIVSILLLNASNLFAKVYWLPDFLGDNTNRFNGLDENHEGGVVNHERGCPNGWLGATQKGDMICDLMGSYPWVGSCYGNCKCKLDKYPYTSDNCSGTKAPSGDECNDGTVHYKECIDACETVEGVTNCPYGCKTTYAAEGCPTECKECYTDNCHNRTSVGSCSYGCESYFSDCSSKCQKCYADNCRNRMSVIDSCDYGCEIYFSDCPSKCQQCYGDNCSGRTDVGPCDYGCETYFSDCPSKCKKCYADNCRNRTDNATDLGCDSYWQDCSSKCKVGKTCVPTDCSAYTLTSCPANATCTNCIIGCEDNTKKYKLSSCNSGYEKSGNTCKACDFSGYTLTSCPSNGTCTSKTCGGSTKYKLSSCNSGYEKSGNTCKACDFSGYTLTSCPSNGTCTSKTCGGSTKYKLSSCNSGYEVSGSTCKACDFSGYTLTSCPSNGTCTSKTCGGSTKYNFTGCNSGYELNAAGTACNEKTTCNFGCALTSCPDGGNCTNITCDGVTKLDLTNCTKKKGYIKSGCSCIASECPLGTFPSTQTPLSACGSDPSDGNGTWMLTTPEGGVTAWSGGYGCWVCYLKCNEGYEQSGNSCTPCVNWNTYLEDCDTSIYQCREHQCQGYTRYEKTGCKFDDNYFENGQCKDCTWPDGAKLMCDFTKDRDNICDTVTCGRTTKYLANDCIDGYTLVNRVCVAM